MTGDRFRAGKRLWSAADDALLRAIYHNTSTADVARRLRRTIASTYARAKKLGLVKSDAYLASPLSCRLRRGDHVGARFRFRRGHVPANKGLRRPGWYRGRMKETQFKKGVPSRNAMPVGGTRLVDGYVYRKVSDVPKVPWTVNWKPEHVLIWTRAHGPVPPGHALTFRDGERTHTQLENLALISRRELMARNSVHNLPPALEHTIQLLGALHRKIRRRTEHAQQA